MAFASARWCAWRTPPSIRKSETAYPVIAQSLQLAASQQIRNMASLGGNVLQRTRCTYFRDVSYAACNKRNPGSGCAAIDGFNRSHAVLGVSDHCIATYAGDFAQALIALDATVEIAGPKGARTIPFAALHRKPGDTPDIETTLQPGEMIASFMVPAAPWTRRSLYLKVRDRESYEFALASAAVALDLQNGDVRNARIALGGVATVPWRAKEAEAALRGKPVTAEMRGAAAEAAFAGAQGREAQRIQDRARQAHLEPRAAAGRGAGDLTWQTQQLPTPKANMGEPVPRYDARLKVTGEARYPADMPVSNPAYAFLVTSAIAKGTDRRLDLDDARAVPGVLDILTHENTAELKDVKFGGGASTSIQSLGPEILHDGQIIAVVLADTFEAAREAAYRVKVTYAEEKPSATFGSPGVTEEDATKVSEEHKTAAAGRRRRGSDCGRRGRRSTPNTRRRRSTTIRSSCSRRPASGRTTSSPSMSRASSSTA